MTWTPTIQLWSLALTWTKTSGCLQFLPEMFNAHDERAANRNGMVRQRLANYLRNKWLWELALWNETGPVGIMPINVPGVAFLIHLTRSHADNKNLTYSRRIQPPDLIPLSLYPLNVNNITKLCTRTYTKTRYCQSTVTLNDLSSCINPLNVELYPICWHY
jgi:hypothetical protein